MSMFSTDDLSRILLAYKVIWLYGIRGCVETVCARRPSVELDFRAMLQASVSSEVAQFLNRVLSVTWNRKIFRVGDHGEFIGLAPVNAEAGGAICILLGCRVLAIALVRQSRAVLQINW